MDGATQASIESIAGLLFARGEQQLVPFLGAGVSLSGRPRPAASDEPTAFPTPETIDAVLKLLGLEGRAGVFVEVAILVSSLIAARQDHPEPKAAKFIEGLEKNVYPPSSNELAQAFCHLLNYSSYKGVAHQILDQLAAGRPRVTSEDLTAALRLASCALGVACPPDALTSISGYYEVRADRRQLWQKLKQIFADKTTQTRTHDLLAAAAQHNLDPTNAQALQDYLIVTTNYDSLMEAALDARSVPYVVLLTDRGTPPTVHMRLSSNVGDESLRQRLLERHSGKVPRNFALSIKQQRVAVVYKIHGCLDSAFDREEDGVVISDSDYVNYISQMSSGDGAIPAHVGDLMQDKRLLFLGYSLSDWNVRSVFETVRRKRGESLRDYSVMRSVRDYERGFFDKHQVGIVEADLNEFAECVQQTRVGGDTM